MRTACLLSIAVLLVWAGESLGWPPSRVEIVPQNPTSSDVIEITLSGDWPDTCIPTASAVLASGNDIYFDVISNSLLMRPCAMVDTPWRQTQSTGPLVPGIYTVYARHVEHPLWSPPYSVPVPDPKLYSRIAEFRVTASAQAYRYIFDRDQSTVVQTGGFAGIHETHSIEGQFELTVDFDSGEARFNRVDAILSESSYLPTRNLNDLFRMTAMVGTVVGDTAVQFETAPLPGGISGNLMLIFGDGTAKMTGRFAEPWVDGFNFDWRAIAWKKAVIYYINGASGADDNDGLSPQTAFATIQRGIDSARNGDTLIVYPGMYKEDINFLGKNVTLTSTDPTDSSTVRSTTIEGSVRFRGTEEPNCILAGFNIDGSIVGYDWEIDPSGENHTHAAISHCILENIATACGEVIKACDGAIRNCVIANINYMCRRPSPIPEIVRCHGLIRNCTMVNMWEGIEVGVGGTCTIQNCILLGSSPIIVPSGATLNISYCCVERGSDVVTGDGTINWGPGNIENDPCFVRIGEWLTDGDYHLKSQAGRWDPNTGRWVADSVTSPCIDAGDPMSPIGQEPFPNGGVTNMGAYGGTAEASKSYFGKPRCEIIIAGDINGDCLIDFRDFQLMALHWREDNDP